LGPRRCAYLLTALAFSPATAHAQKDLFPERVRDLASAVAVTDASRSNRIASAVDGLAGSLAEWDRNIDAFAAGAARETRDASPARRVELHGALGRMYLERGRFDDAVREFDRAVAERSGPQRADIALLRAVALDAAGSTDSATQAFRSAWEAGIGDAVAAYYAARREGVTADADRERALESLRSTYARIAAARDGPGTPPFATAGVFNDLPSTTVVIADASLAAGVAALAQHKYDEAVTSLRTGLKAAVYDGTTDSPRTHFARGQSFEQQNLLSQARREYAAAASGVLAGRTVLYSTIGSLAHVEGDFAAATAAFTAAVRISPNDASLRRQLAEGLTLQDRLDEAFCELLAALLIDPRDAQAHAGIGRFYLETGRDADAVVALSRAIELSPDAYEIRYPLAAALARVGNAAEAARQLGIFEAARRLMLERRRGELATSVEREEALRQKLLPEDARK
jgi:tetratricopeptide (TPR) repeat protein